MVLALLILVAGGLVFSHFHGVRPRLAATPSPSVGRAADVRTASAKPTTLAPPTRSATHRPAATANICKSNTQRQRVIVSIGKQHAWICNGSHQVYDSNVTTGASAVGSGTPTGTWQVLAKQTNRRLTVRSGDSYFVKYWMPVSTRRLWLPRLELAELRLRQRQVPNSMGRTAACTSR